MRTFVSLALFGVTALNLFKNTVFPALIAIASLFITLTVTMGSAQAGSTTLSLVTVLGVQSDPAVTVNSATSVTIASDNLASETNNSIVFTSTVTADPDHPIKGVNAGSTAPKDSSAIKTTQTASNTLNQLTYTIPIDKVAHGSAPLTFTFSVQAYSGPRQEPVASCSEAVQNNIGEDENQWQFACTTTTMTVTVVQVSTPDPVNLIVDITAQSNSAVTSSGTTVTIDSDSLAAETGNLVAFDLSAMINNNDSYTIDSLIATSTSTSAGSATLGSITTSTTSTAGTATLGSTTTSTNASGIPSTRTDSRIYTLPVDKVAVGSAAASFTITVTAFTDLRASDTVSSCAAATSDSLNTCVSKTITVMVDPANSKSARTAALATNFIRRRIRNTLNAEPGLSDQLNNDGGESVAPVGYGFAQNGNSFDVNLSGNKSFGFGYGAEEEERFNLWFKSSIARITEAGVKQKFSVGHVGLGYKVNSDLVVGALAQFDNAKEVDGVATVKGTGWLVGPYLAANVHEKLVFEGRVALGASSNKISPLGTYTDKFTTKRFLARGKISGDFQQGEWKVAPNFAVQYMRENRATYVDNVGTTIPSSTISLGQFVFGTDFSTAFEKENGTTISPSVGFKGLWNFADTGFFDPATGLISSTEAGDVSARFDAGVLFDNNDGLTLSLNGFYDGVGAKNYEGFGGTAKFLIKF